MNGIHLSESMIAYLTDAVCTAINIMQPPIIRASFRPSADVQDIGLDPGFDPEQCTVLAIDYNSTNNELVLVWVERDVLINQSKEVPDA